MASYKQLQGSGVVGAAAVGSFTRPNVRQLVVFKQMALEIWEFENDRPCRVANADLWLNACNCALLQNPWGVGNLSSTTLDRIVVADDKGNTSVFEWSLSIVKDLPIKVIQTESEKLEAVLPHSVFSRPLTFHGDTPLSTLVERSRHKDIGAKDWFGKIRSISLIAMAVYKNLIQVLVAAWVPVTRYQKTNFQGAITHRPVLNEYHLNMSGEPGLITIALQLQNGPSILDLAFIAGLDWKARPLLVVLSAQDGLVYSLVTVQCFAINLEEGRLEPGPWKIRNLHPTSTFVLSWYQEGVVSTQKKPGDMAIETGIGEGLGVLVISSVGVLFIDSLGHRTSVSFEATLSGSPTSFEIVKDQTLVLQDNSGALYVLNLMKWDDHLLQKVKHPVSYSPLHILLLVHFEEEETSKSKSVILFASGKSCSARFFILQPSVTNEAGIYQASLCREREDMLAGIPAELSQSMQSVDGSRPAEGKNNWRMQEMVTQPISLEDITCVRDMILVDEPLQSPQPQLIVACGTAPSATVRRGIVGVGFKRLKFLDNEVRGYPRLIPLKCKDHSEHHTHVLLSYSAEGTSDVISLNGETTEWQNYGLQRNFCTLDAMVVSDGWLVQVTTFSMRVLSFVDPEALVAEWKPPTERKPKNTINRGPKAKRSSGPCIRHASLCIDGAALVADSTVYSLRLNHNGEVDVLGTNIRLHEVSALGVFEFWIAGDTNAGRKRKKLYAKHLTSPRIAFENADLYFIVVLAQWHTNTVHLLAWPDLEELAHFQAGSVPVRCVHVTAMGNTQYLIVGDSDGNAFCSEIKYEIPSEDKDARYSTLGSDLFESTTTKCTQNRSSDVEEGVCSSWSSKISCSHVPARLQDDADQALVKFRLKLVLENTFNLGRSVECITTGPMCGAAFDFTRNVRLENLDCVFVQGDQSMVICCTEDGDLQAFHVWDPSQPFVALCRIHTKVIPNGLLILNRSRHLVLGHLDMSERLQLRDVSDALHFVHSIYSLGFR